VWVLGEQRLEARNVALLGEGVHCRLGLGRPRCWTAALTGGGSSSIMVARPTSSLIRPSGSSSRRLGEPAGGVAAVVVILGTLAITDVRDVDGRGGKSKIKKDGAWRCSPRLETAGPWRWQFNSSTRPA
jgi:hypothetical protein